MKGHTYFDWREGFSINEGEFPNICLLWKYSGLFFYIALWHHVRFFFNLPLRFTNIGWGENTKGHVLWSRKQ